MVFHISHRSRLRSNTVNVVQMSTSASERHGSALQPALRTARENENRWLKMHAEYATDTEGAEQWANTAKLRRLEVGRLEAILGDTERQ